MINLNKNYSGLLDDMYFTKVGRISAENKYEVIILSLKSIIKSRSYPNYKVAEKLFDVLYEIDKSFVTNTKDSLDVYVGVEETEPKLMNEILFGKRFTLSILKYLGYDYGSISVFDRKWYKLSQTKKLEEKL